MKFSTTNFGELDVRDEEIYSFPHGIPGFEQMSRFVLLEVKEQAPFSYLQSLDNPELIFILIDPFEFFPSYEFDLADTVVQDFQIEHEHVVLVRSIVSTVNGIHDATANLVAPVILNTVKRIGKQLVLSTGNYSTRHRLYAPKAKE